MRVRAYLPNQEPQSIEIGDELEAQQTFVGGYIEAIPIGHGLWLVCNEEGKLQRLRPNRRIPNGDIIAGAFFVCRSNGEDFVGLSLKDDALADSLFF